MITILSMVAVAIMMRRLREAPKIEPTFESIAQERAGPVSDFTLRDGNGTLHTNGEWSNHRAIVLLFCKFNQPESVHAALATAKLAAAFNPRGMLFLAVCSEPPALGEQARALAVAAGPALPIVFDPQQVVARQAGVRGLPEAVVLAPDGQVMYRGAVTQPPVAPRRLNSEDARCDLESAIRSIDRDELPAVFSTPEAAGSPLPALHRRGGRPVFPSRRSISRGMSRPFCGSTVPAVTAGEKSVHFRL